MNLLDAPLARLDGTPGTLRDLTGGQPALLVNGDARCAQTRTRRICRHGAVTAAKSPRH